MVGSEGDGCLVVFRSGADAVAAAAAAQRGHAAHPWPPDSIVRVRMGLHTGDAVLGDEGYVGLAIHHGARIGAAGEGGQVLLSSITARLVAHQLPEGVELRDIGERPLRDLDTPERLFELVIDGAPGSAARPGAIRVLIADDQALVRSGFTMILETQRDIHIVGDAEDGAEAVRLVGELEPDVVLMDIRMPELDGLEATRRILALPNAPRVIVLTTFDMNEYVYEAMTAGASGFLLSRTRGPSYWSTRCGRSRTAMRSSPHDHEAADRGVHEPACAGGLRVHGTRRARRARARDPRARRAGTLQRRDRVVALDRRGDGRCLRRGDSREARAARPRPGRRRRVPDRPRAGGQVAFSV
jgi:CheY-like chemotaxis protein